MGTNNSVGTLYYGQASGPHVISAEEKKDDKEETDHSKIYFFTNFPGHVYKILNSAPSYLRESLQNGIPFVSGSFLKQIESKNSNVLDARVATANQITAHKNKYLLFLVGQVASMFPGRKETPYKRNNNLVDKHFACSCWNGIITHVETRTVTKEDSTPLYPSSFYRSLRTDLVLYLILHDLPGFGAFTTQDKKHTAFAAVEYAKNDTLFELNFSAIDGKNRRDGDCISTATKSAFSREITVSEFLIRIFKEKLWRCKLSACDQRMIFQAEYVRIT